MKTLKLKNHPYAQCSIDVITDIDGNKDINFWSYSTHVISIREKDGKRYALCTGTYSQTTRKQIGWFLREYAPDLNYYDMKNIVGLGAVEL